MQTLQSVHRECQAYHTELWGYRGKEKNSAYQQPGDESDSSILGNSFWTMLRAKSYLNND